MYVPASPSDLCRMLRLDPEPEQIELMETLVRRRGYVDTALRCPHDESIDESALRAALMVILWRTLRVPGSRATILAPSAGAELASGELGHLAMAFLAEVCKTRDGPLGELTRVRAWHVIEFGAEPGWEIRFCHNSPSSVAESARRSLTGLVIDAGDATSALGEAAREMKPVADEPRGLVIRLW